MIQKCPLPGGSGATSYTGVSKALTFFHLIFLNIASPKANYGTQLPLPKLYIVLKKLTGSNISDLLSCQLSLNLK